MKYLNGQYHPYVLLYGDLIDSLFDYDPKNIYIDAGEFTIDNVIAKTNINDKFKEGDKIDLIYIHEANPHLLFGEKCLNKDYHRYETLFVLKLKASLNNA